MKLIMFIFSCAEIKVCQNRTDIIFLKVQYKTLIAKKSHDTAMQYWYMYIFKLKDFLFFCFFPTLP